MNKPHPSAAARPPAPRPRARPGRPRKQPDAAGGDAVLGRARILRAALALIDEKGLAAFTIRGLGVALGVFPAALYWHVPNRDALVSGAIALALDEVAVDLSGGPWQQRLRVVMQRFREALRRHPRLAPAVANELAYNASFNAAMLDHIVSALEDARFEGDALVDAFNVVIAALCGFATLELSTAPAGPPDVWEAACRAQIDAVDARRHPHLHRHRDALRNRAFLLRWSSGAELALDSGFDAWVDVIVRGLASRSRALRKA